MRGITLIVPNATAREALLVVVDLEAVDEAVAVPDAPEAVVDSASVPFKRMALRYN